MVERRVACIEARPARRAGACSARRHRARAVGAAATVAALLAALAGLAAPPAAAEMRPPEPLRRPLPKPPYPLESRRLGEEGDVRISLRVDATGWVQHIDILESSGSPALDAAALAAAASWRFRPATRDGEPVAGTVNTAIRFRMRPPRRGARPAPA